MRIEQLLFLIEISKQKSINIASEKLYITQQALSSSIKTMEKELEVKLLHRSRQGCTLTPQGELVLQYAADVVPKYQKLVQVLRVETALDRQKDLQGTLQIYVNSIFYVSLLPEIIKRFCEKCPLLKIVILEKSPAGICAKLEESLEEGVHRIGLLNVPYATDGTLCSEFMPASSLTFYPLAKGSYHACVSKSSLLAKNKELSLKTLLKHPLIVGASDEANITPLHYLLTQYGKPDIVLSVASLTLWNHAIVNNMGIGFLHDIFLDNMTPLQNYLDELVPIKIKEKMMAVTGYLLAEKPSPVIEALIDFLPMGKNM